MNEKATDGIGVGVTPMEQARGGDDERFRAHRERHLALSLAMSELSDTLSKALNPELPFHYDFSDDIKPDLDAVLLVIEKFDELADSRGQWRGRD